MWKVWNSLLHVDAYILSSNFLLLLCLIDYLRIAFKDLFFEQTDLE